MKKKQNLVWMEVSKDKYELPIRVADSIGELAKMCHTTQNNISSQFYHYKAGRQKTCRFRKVEIDDEED